MCRNKSDEDGLTRCKCKVHNADDLKECACVDQVENDAAKMEKQNASNVLTAIKNALSNENNNYDNVEQLFDSLGVSQGTFEAAYQCFARNTHVVLKRQVNEVWVN